MERFGKAFAAILFAGFLFANIAVASAIPLANTGVRTVDEIRAKWTLDKPVYSGSAFLVNPGVTAPYSTGVLQPGYMQDALDKTNFARYLVGLPDDVTLDVAYTDEVQHSAVVLAGIGGSLTHYPIKPADMSQKFFDIGYSGTTSSNIAAGNMALHLTVDTYLSDAEGYNIAVVGHRRWILNPSLAKTGFGWAKKTGSTYNTYSAMHTFDRSRSDAVTYNSYGWPAAGFFPREFFPTGTPWSIHLDTFDYVYSMAGVTVTLTRVGDGASWTFNSADHTADTSGSGEYFNIDNSGYGSPACIIFRPPLSLHYNVGDAFDVRVSGKLYTKGTTNPVQLNYRTTFFDLVRPNTAPVTIADNIGYYANTATINLTTSDDVDGADVAHTYYILNGFPVTEGKVISVAGANTYALSYWSVDSAGNEEKHHTAIFRILATPSASGTPSMPSISTSVVHGRSRTYSGYVSRHTSGTSPVTLRFYRYKSGHWVYYKSTTARVSNMLTFSKYSDATSVPYVGKWRVRAVHKVGTKYRYSGYRYFTAS